MPRLQYLEVLFGEETVLPAPERFYQRMLGSNTSEATTLQFRLETTQTIVRFIDSMLDQLSGSRRRTAGTRTR